MSPTSVSTRKKVTINTIRSFYEKSTPITMMTAHDFPSALAADLAEMDMILVGDSLAMVALGLEDTNQITLDDMIHHCRAVARGAKTAFLVGDLPMGSYEESPALAIRSALRLIQEGRVSAVKMEGGEELVPTISRLTALGIPVLGHVGLTPQRSASLGGFRVQGKTVSGAVKVLKDALALQEAGVFGMVLEAVPEEVARVVTERLNVPTIGIGAGKGTSGQVLVQVDCLGNYPQGRFMPKFVKVYADVFGESLRGLEAYREEVRSGQYPSVDHTYPMLEKSVTDFKKAVDEEYGTLKGKE